MQLLILILVMALVTYLPRIIPLLILTRIHLPAPVLEWLKYLPVAILSALLAPALLMPANTWDLSLSNSFLLAALPTFLVARLSRSLMLTVFAGMFFLMIMGLF